MYTIDVTKVNEIIMKNKTSASSKAAAQKGSKVVINAGPSVIDTNNESFVSHKTMDDESNKAMPQTF